MNNMRLPTLDFSEPKTIQKLMELKRTHGELGLLFAGGTDIIPGLKRRNISTRLLINIKKIPEFRQISFDQEEGLKLGPAVTLRELTDNPMILTHYPILAKSASLVGFNHLRNMGTIGGNLCLDNKCTYFNQSAFWWKSRPDCFKRGGQRCYVAKGGKGCFALSAADTVSPLIALDTELLIQSPDGKRRLPLISFFTGDGRQPHHIAGDEVLTSIIVPPPSQGWREGFLKKSFRGSVDFSVATLSVRLRGPNTALEDVRLVLNSVSTKPVRAYRAEEYLREKGLDRETIRKALDLLLEEVRPLSSVWASPRLRRAMIAAMFNDMMDMFIAGQSS